RKKWKEDTPQRMEKLLESFEKTEFLSAELEATFKAFLEREELGMGAVLPNLRLIITGQGMGPGMFDIMELLGKEESLERMKTGIANLS
ncbi:MAG: glutamate--tRNA ligase, partial [Flavobacteriales bacterium]|nr:glutamate--tRNA ligase [Flavobacteriales bacterium]